MPTHDEEFIKRLRATFQVEAEEHLQAIATGLLAMEKAPSAAERQSAIENIYREAHSLKGAARAVDMADIETICQAMENVFSQWKREAVTPSTEGFDILHKSVDAIRNLLGGGAGTHTQGHSRLLGQLARLTDRPRATAPSEPVASREPVPATTTSPIEAEHNVSETVRIDAAKLDAQLLRAEELLPFKALMTQRARDLRELLDRMERWNKQWARASAVVQSAGLPDERHGAGSSSEFLEWNVDFHRSLEQRLRTMAAQADRDQYHVSKRLDELLQDSKRLVMFPFSTLTGVFPKIVRDLCREQGKEAELTIQGGDVEIDKRILEEMKDAIVHMLRNSVDHGIEIPAERVRRGKSSTGRISITVAQVNGSKVEMVVADDGEGIDLEGVKEAAIRRNLLSPSDAPTLQQADALTLIFHSEVSTRKSVTAVSGRGLGMAIVQSKVEKLGGQLWIESKRAAGTKVRIVLPLTLATFRGILVVASDQTFVVPAANVERVLRVRPSDIRTVENRETLSIEAEQGHVLSLVRLAAVLELPSPSRPLGASAIPVLILRAAGERIAFAVDEVMHEEEVLVKPLRKPLIRVRNIGGATILANGKAVPTLNVGDLIKSARVQPRAGSPAASPAPEKASAKRVLVVEDSITSRMLLKGILESAGYQVQVAVDGMEAFARLRETECDIVVSDVEMPRLNGFDLTAKIRADKRLSELPVVLVTALESRAQRERGLEVGANAYIVKSSFDQSNLLEVVRRLL